MENTQQCLTTNNRPRGGVCEDIYTTDILCLKKINNVFLIINLNFKAMRKSTLLKMAFASAAMFVFVGASAQTNTGQWGTTATVGKYTQSAAAPITDYNLVNYTQMYITTGKTMPFFVGHRLLITPTGIQVLPLLLIQTSLHRLNWRTTFYLLLHGRLVLTMQV